MRWFFNYFDGPTILHGYALPTSTEHPSSNTLGFATQIIITFEAGDHCLRFDVNVDYVKMDSLSSMLLDSVKQNIKRIEECLHIIPENCHYQHQQFLKLPKQFLDKNGFTEQFYSKHSIVLANDVSVFKYINNEAERLRAMDLYVCKKDLDLQRSLLPNDIVKIAGLVFLQYPRLPQPNDLDASRILPSIIEAIKELHNKNIAHLDIRPDNMCYHQEKAILIDLDRSANAQDFYAGNITYKKSCMYTWPSGIPIEKQIFNKIMDWVQLGFMLIWLVGGEWKNEDMSYHDMNQDTLTKLDGVTSEFRDFLSYLTSKGKVKIKRLVRNCIISGELHDIPHQFSPNRGQQ